MTLNGYIHARYSAIKHRHHIFQKISNMISTSSISFTEHKQNDFKLYVTMKQLFVQPTTLYTSNSFKILEALKTTLILFVLDICLYNFQWWTSVYASKHALCYWNIDKRKISEGSFYYNAQSVVA